MIQKNQAVRNRRLALLLVVLICGMIVLTMVWMSQYNAMLGG